MPPLTAAGRTGSRAWQRGRRWLTQGSFPLSSDLTLSYYRVESCMVRAERIYTWIRQRGNAPGQWLGAPVRVAGPLAGVVLAAAGPERVPALRAAVAVLPGVLAAGCLGQAVARALRPGHDGAAGVGDCAGRAPPGRAGERPACPCTAATETDLQLVENDPAPLRALPGSLARPGPLAKPEFRIWMVADEPKPWRSSSSGRGVASS